jgi:hypothetical protein
VTKVFSIGLLFPALPSAARIAEQRPGVAAEYAAPLRPGVFSGAADMVVDIQRQARPRTVDLRAVRVLLARGGPVIGGRDPALPAGHRLGGEGEASSAVVPALRVPPALPVAPALVFDGGEVLADRHRASGDLTWRSYTTIVPATATVIRCASAVGIWIGG